MTDIPAVLANDFLAAQGLACIHIQPVPDGTTIVTISDIAARSEPGSRIWFKKLKDAEKTMAAFFSRDQRSRRRPRGAAGLLVDADVTAVDKAIRDVAFSLGVAVVDAAVIEQQFALVSGRIEAALKRMQRDGSMKKLNRAYKAARDAGEALPGYANWLIDRMRKTITDNAFAGAI